VSDRRTPDATLIEAVRILSRTIQTDDGVIPACLGEVATRLSELVEERRSISTLLQKVESLEAENNRLREERRWVPVGERVPDDTVECLVFHKRSKECRRAYVYKGDWWDGVYLITGNVTHWRPLPPGPEGDA